MRLQRTLALCSLLLLLGCRNSALLGPLPGTNWILEEATIDSMTFQQVPKTPNVGGSRTLYAGSINGDVVGVLLKLALPDSLTLAADSISAELVLFRRVYRDSLPDQMTLFRAAVVMADSGFWEEGSLDLIVDDIPVDETFPQVSFVTDTVEVQGADSLELRTDLEHIRIPLPAQLLRDWREGIIENNGLLLTQPGGGPVSSFHSRGASLYPRLAVTYTDTTDTTDGMTTDRFRLQADLSIYAPPSTIMPGDSASAIMSLNFAAGWGVHLDFGSQFQSEPDRAILAAHIVLNSVQQPDDLVASLVDLSIDRRATAIADSDSFAVAISNLSYTVEEGNWRVDLGALLDDFNRGNFENFGIDLIVNPRQYDFDTLEFISPAHPDSALRPRIELLYGRSFKEQSE